MGCPGCHRQDVGEIRFATVGSGIVFRYCRMCEHRWWEGADGATLDLRAVLDAASVLSRSA